MANSGQAPLSVPGWGLVPIVMLAAGASRRMRGLDKLMQPVGGVPLVVRQVDKALATGQPVLVCLPWGASARRAALAGRRVHLVEIADAAEGMAASVRGGVAAVPLGAAGLMLHLADLPDIETDDLRTLFDAFAEAAGGRIVQATSHDGVPGHPVLFPARLFADLRRLSGDAGARGLLASERAEILRVALPGTRATTDLDSPEDWAEWRARTGL